jgi:hypothetical protein
MKSLISDALEKFEEKVIELKQLEYLKTHHANLPRAKADTAPIREQIESIRAGIIEVASTPSIPPHVRDFLGKVQGVCLGVAISGSDHPNPDEVLMEIFTEAQDILFPPKVG